MENIMLYSGHIAIIFLISILILSVFMVVRTNKDYKRINKILNKSKEATTREEIQEIRNDIENFSKTYKVNNYSNIIYIIKMVLDSKEMMIDKYNL